MEIKVGMTVFWPSYWGDRMEGVVTEITDDVTPWGKHWIKVRTDAGHIFRKTEDSCSLEWRDQV